MLVVMSNLASCMEIMRLPWGLQTVIGWEVERLLMICALWLAKLCVLPMAAITWMMFGAGLMSGAGGPIVKQVSIVELLFENNCFIWLWLLVGFHQSQLGG